MTVTVVREGRASRKGVYVGRALGGLVVFLLAMDSIMKFFKPAVVVEGTLKLGLPEHLIVPLGVILLGSTILYAIPRTSVLGAVLLTGYLGGAVCTHLRVGDPLFSHVLFPSYLGAVIWGALWLREARVRALFVPRSAPQDML
jgi:hypothetical protein